MWDLHLDFKVFIQFYFNDLHMVTSIILCFVFSNYPADISKSIYMQILNQFNKVVAERFNYR